MSLEPQPSRAASRRRRRVASAAAAGAAAAARAAGRRRSGSGAAPPLPAEAALHAPATAAAPVAPAAEQAAAAAAARPAAAAAAAAPAAAPAAPPAGAPCGGREVARNAGPLAGPLRAGGAGAGAGGAGVSAATASRRAGAGHAVGAGTGRCRSSGRPCAVRLRPTPRPPRSRPPTALLPGSRRRRSSRQLGRSGAGAGRMGHASQQPPAAVERMAAAAGRPFRFPTGTLLPGRLCWRVLCGCSSSSTGWGTGSGWNTGGLASLQASLPDALPSARPRCSVCSLNAGGPVVAAPGHHLRVLTAAHPLPAFPGCSLRRLFLQGLQRCCKLWHLPFSAYRIEGQMEVGPACAACPRPACYANRPSWLATPAWLCLGTAGFLSCWVPNLRPCLVRIASGCSVQQAAPPRIPNPPPNPTPTPTLPPHAPLQRLQRGFVCRRELGAPFAQLLLVSAARTARTACDPPSPAPAVPYRGARSHAHSLCRSCPSLFPPRCTFPCRPCSGRAVCGSTCPRPAAGGG